MNFKKMWCSSYNPLCVGEGYDIHERENQECLIKYVKSIINAKGKYNISLVSVNQANKLIISSKKFALLFLRKNQLGYEPIEINASLEGCNKEKKTPVREDFATI